MKPFQEGCVGANEAKTHFSKLLDRVTEGEVVTITRRGHPIARMVPITTKRHSTVEERRAAIEGIIKLSEGLSLGGMKIKDLIEEGRR